MPPSTSTSIRPSTASATSGRTAAVGQTVSSWRAPWFETTTPARPASTASFASSASMTPLPSSGRPRRGGELRDVVPGDRAVERRVPVLDDHRVRPLELRRHRAVAKPGRGLVDGEHERLEPELVGAVGQLAGQAAVGEEVEVEPPRGVGRGGRDILHRLRRPAREDVDAARRGRRRAGARPRRRGGRAPATPSAPRRTGAAASCRGSSRRCPAPRRRRGSAGAARCCARPRRWPRA